MNDHSPVGGAVVLSVDLEDWPQSTFDRSLAITQRCVDNAKALLDLFDETGQKATFFALGKDVESFPDLVKEVADRGHEVATHGYGHVEIFHQTAEEFRADVERSCNALQEVTGSWPLGYRAPDFSIVPSTLWALEVLADLGLRYDSSIYPIRHPRYGIAHWPTDPRRVELPAGGSVVEFPLSVVAMGRQRLPVAGGGYHRLLPYPVTHVALRSVMRRVGTVVTYCHPYEFDRRELHELPFDVPLKTRLHQGLGRGRFGARYRRLLRDFPCVTFRDLIEKPWPVYSPAPGSSLRAAI